jgi:lipoate synthase
MSGSTVLSRFYVYLPIVITLGLFSLCCVALNQESKLSAHAKHPDTLNPSKFADNQRAFAAYTIAGRIKKTLSQVPCQCGCEKEQKHKNLLDCFASKHGAICGICQQEAIFCYLEHGKHKNPAQIRNAIVAGMARKIDVAKFAAEFRPERELAPNVH